MSTNKLKLYALKTEAVMLDFRKDPKGEEMVVDFREDPKTEMMVDPETRTS